jgi:hypothetical protein
VGELADKPTKKPGEASSDDLLQPLDQIGPPPEELQEDFADEPPDELPSVSGGRRGEPLGGLDDLLTPKEKLPAGGRSASITTFLARQAPGALLRALAFRPGGQNPADALGFDAAVLYYLNVATFQHALEDGQRAPGDRLYDWSELHMSGLLDAHAKLKSADEEEAEALRAEGRKDRTLAIEQRVAGCRTVAEALAAIRSFREGEDG